MERPVIDVRSVSKIYHLGPGRTTHLRDEVAQIWARMIHTPPIRSGEELWALRDVSFKVRQGEALGLIGGNGAGKSTLLKILSRITRQTAGEIVLRGRVTSLLEVGTGFHPDLTGRENTFLNGAILGMTRVEIKRKFDEIVAFAEIDRFIDTPVKRYSSGMYVRLAFAVAAHLEPEILIVDEVLAVGDFAFQRKCMGKMRDVSALQGRTVLFVSHNMAAITALCPRSVHLENGSLMVIGPTNEVISNYLQTGQGATYEKKPKTPFPSSHPAWIRRAWVESKTEMGAAEDTLRTGETFTLNVEICLPSAESIDLIVSFHDQLRRPLWTSTNRIPLEGDISPGTRVLIKQRYLLPHLTIAGITIDLATTDVTKYPFLDHVVNAITLSIAQLEGVDYKAQNASFPFLVEPHQEMFVIGK